MSTLGQILSRALATGLAVGRNTINNVLVPLEWTAVSGLRTPTHLPPPLASPSSALLPRLHVNNHGDSIASGFPFLIRASGALVPIPDPLGGVSFGGEDVNDTLRAIGQSPPGPPAGRSSPGNTPPFTRSCPFDCWRAHLQ